MPGTLKVATAVAAGLLVAVACGDDGATSPTTDDPRTSACQRGTLQSGVDRTSSLNAGDCRSDGYLFEVWTLTVPSEMLATVTLTPVFDGVLSFFDTTGVFLISVDLKGAGNPDEEVIRQSGSYFVVVSASSPDETGAYGIRADIGFPTLGGSYTGTVSGTYAGAPFSAAINFMLTTSGSAVSGSWTVPAFGNSGTIAGTITGSTLGFTLTQNFPCMGTYSGSGTIENGGLRLSGSFSGSDCQGAASGSFVVDFP